MHLFAFILNMSFLSIMAQGFREEGSQVMFFRIAITVQTTGLGPQNHSWKFVQKIDIANIVQSYLDPQPPQKSCFRGAG